MQPLRNEKHQGFLVTFEGSEAVGKSTIIQKIADFLHDNHIDYVHSREPGGTLLAEKIRNLIFSDTHRPSAMTELLLLFAARQSHIETVIRPALMDNKIILCDRYIDSSYIYQSLMHKIPENIIDNLIECFVKPTFPDICFIIDCPATESYQRIHKRGIMNDNDNQSVEHLNIIREGFLQRAKTNTLYPYYIIENNDLNKSVQDIIHILQEKIISNLNGG